VAKFIPRQNLSYTQTKPVDKGTQLTLTLKCPPEDDVARNCAGREAHLIMLLAAIEGVPIKSPFERFQSSRLAYNEMA
jgi:hypothetical protein